MRGAEGHGLEEGKMSTSDAADLTIFQASGGLGKEALVTTTDAFEQQLVQDEFTGT